MTDGTEKPIRSANLQRQTTNLAINQATKKILAKNFPTQKNPEIENFKPPKIFRSSQSREIWSTPPPPGTQAKKSSKNLLVTVNLKNKDVEKRGIYKLAGTLVQSAYHF